MHSLGKDGNDAVESFQRSTSLQHLLDTEDIIHGFATVYAVTEPASTSSSDDSEIANGRRDLLIDLTPDVLTTIKKNKERWSSFVGKVRSYCCPKKVIVNPFSKKHSSVCMKICATIKLIQMDSR